MKLSRRQEESSGSKQPRNRATRQRSNCSTSPLDMNHFLLSEFPMTEIPELHTVFLMLSDAC